MGLDERGAFSREKLGSGWLGRVFLEKSLGLDAWGAHFLRKAWVWMAGARVSREKPGGFDQKI